MSGKGKTRRSVTATEAAKNFGELVDRVREGGVAYVIERKGRPIAEIAPIAGHEVTVRDLAEWFGSRRALPADYVDEVRKRVADANRPRIPAARWRP